MAEEQIAYRKGCVYKIVCNVTGEQYIGSTFDLEKRKTKHLHKNSGCASWPIIERGDYEFIKLFECCVPNTEELRKIEQSFIESTKCLNKIRAFVSETQKKAERAERDKIKPELIPCACGGSYSNRYKNKHFRSKKHRIFETVNCQTYVANTQKVVINISINCSCGGRYTKKHQKTHFKTEKHQKHQSEQNAN